ncbi:MAG: hypothetical protein R2827_15750 [Bdellovibrionales bacterium]
MRAAQNNGVDPLDGSSISLWKDRLSVIFQEMIHSKNKYIQIRYIGVADDGKELVESTGMAVEFSRE